MTARDFKLDASGDWDVSAGDLTMLSDADAIIQAARIHLQFFQGEWFLDLTTGLPWWQSLLGKVRDPSVLAPIFRRALLLVPGATRVASLRLTRDGSARSLDVVYQLEADIGLLESVTQAVV